MFKKVIDFLVEVLCIYVSVVAGFWVFEILTPIAGAERSYFGAVGGELFAAAICSVVVYCISGRIGDYLTERWWGEDE